MINWDLRKYTKEEFISAWVSAHSLNGVCRSLGISVSGGSSRIIKETAEELLLGREHFTVSSVRKPLTLEEILVEDSAYVSTTNLKKMLVSLGLLVEECAAPYCPLPSELKNPFSGEDAELKLVLDHINGINRDNRIVNLRLLCQYCHSETDTWCGKNKTRLTSTGSLPMPPVKTGLCGHVVHKYSLNCVACAGSARAGQYKINYPEVDTIVSALASESFESYGKSIGVSGNAVRKHLKRKGVDIKALRKV